MNYNLTDEMQEIIELSRKLSIQYSHGFINYDHFFLALLKSDSAAKKYTDGFPTTVWQKEFGEKYIKEEMNLEDASIPLTVYAEHVIKNAHLLSKQAGKKRIDSICLLLSILCFNNDIKVAYDKIGVIFEDIAIDYTENSLEKISPTFQIAALSKIGKFFSSEEKLKKRATSLYGVAYELYLYEKYTECIRACEIALELDGGLSEPKILKAYSAVAIRDFSLGLAEIKKLIEGDPDNFDYQICLSHIYDELGEYGKAFEIFEKLLIVYPADAVVHNNAGFSFLLQEKFKEAVPYFEKAIQLDNSFAFPLDNLGFVKFKLGYPEDGISLINKSLELDKGNSYAYKFKGLIYQSLGDKKEAMENFNLALKYGYTKSYGNDLIDIMKKIDPEN
ncbi:MAG: hypothetical protein ABL872_17935 [Lacibacter sp.]